MRFAVKKMVVLVVVMSTMRWCSAAADDLSFNRDIRPLLSDNCFQCHGPDAESRETELRLDQREHAVADLGGYAAVVPGKPQESELLRRISSDDPSERMPRKNRARNSRRSRSSYSADGSSREHPGRSTGRLFHPIVRRSRRSRTLTGSAFLLMPSC